MVCIPTYEAMYKYYKNNRLELTREHPGEYMLIEDGIPLKISFYKKKDELMRIIEQKYGRRIGEIFFDKRIPTQKELEKIIYEEENWLTIFLQTLREEEKKFKDIHFTIDT